MESQLNPKDELELMFRHSFRNKYSVVYNSTHRRKSSTMLEFKRWTIVTNSLLLFSLQIDDFIIDRLHLILFFFRRSSPHFLYLFPLPIVL